MRNTAKPRLSENKKDTVCGNSPKIRVTGRVSARDKNSPELTARRSSKGLFSALLLEIKRETVIGIPPVPSVRKTEKIDRATWYKPSPSAPSRRERTIRYKKPKPRSAIESAVTIEAVANKVVRSVLGDVREAEILFFIVLLYEPKLCDMTKR